MKTNIGKALVVGAGISGIRAALDLAETGCRVTLIDRSLHSGGILSQLDYQFPTNRCGMCKMLPLVHRDASSQFCLRKGLFHDNIELRLGCELTAVSGEPGNFSVTLRQAPTQVDPELCIGCGICSQVCPVQVPSEFNAGLGQRKAIYLPVPHAVPNAFVIDSAACDQCGKCIEVCPTDAINLTDEQRQAFQILVVDDELAVRDSLKEWLVDEGFSVDMASSGEQALKMLQEKTYGLMLTDIKMPGMDGVELLQQAREIQPDLTVVMMTAYATVETAVEAMKQGAIDYLMKPFDPAKMIPMVVKIFEEQVASHDLQVQVGAIVLCCGTDYFNPYEGKDTLAYGSNAHVLTSLEFERLISGSGPTAGRLVRPADGKPVNKIAWLQCIGSRDLQTNADFCSSVCCMYALKEAMLAKEKYRQEVETAIFYMDMRNFGLPFQKYLDMARAMPGMRLERTRVHSVTPEPETGNPVLSYIDSDGTLKNESFDLVVLSVGQRPARRTEQLASMTGCDLNKWGFLETSPLTAVSTTRPGIFAGGSATGLKDINESVIFASAAAAEAGVAIHASGGSLAEQEPYQAGRDVSRQVPRILVLICSCGQHIPGHEKQVIEKILQRDPAVAGVTFLEHICTATGWEQLENLALDESINRILIGACHPYLFIRKIKALSKKINLAAHLIDAVDLELFKQFKAGNGSPTGQPTHIAAKLATGIARLKNAPVHDLPTTEVVSTALVVGGGIAGMHTALTIAEQGYPVTLVEEKEHLGGNLQWLQKTIGGDDLQTWLKDTISMVEKHPGIRVMTGSRIIGGYGQAGNFLTTIQTSEDQVETLEHGVVILATGGKEAPTDAYDHGNCKRVITQSQLEKQLADSTIDPSDLDTVVMIQCVGSRQQPRNYCSRVCCPTTIKHCLQLKKARPELNVYVLYRDMMTPGFNESYFTEARKAGVIFIAYDPDNKPEVNTSYDETSIAVSCKDPVSGLNLQIEADLLVLASGIVPNLPAQIAETFGLEVDENGFFKAADYKWRPVDTLKEGVFACGICLGPRSSVESAVTGKAAASRALRILAHPWLISGRPVAQVRASLCALCQRCIEACPYGARELDTDNANVLVNTVMCQGCGTCAAVCPNGASILDGYGRRQVFETIDALIEIPQEKQG